MAEFKQNHSKILFYITLLLLPRKEAGGHLSIRSISINADQTEIEWRQTESQQMKQHESKHTLMYSDREIIFAFAAGGLIAIASAVIIHIQLIYIITKYACNVSKK